MALDAATLALSAAQLKKELIEARIDKIFQPTRDEVVISMRTRAKSFRLLIAARSGTARVCVTNEVYENPATPPSFCMLLRKYLIGGRLLDVRTLQGERIVFLDFLCTNEMGDLVKNTLAAELMGRYCNIVLIKEQIENEAKIYKVVDALKRVDFEDSQIRQLLPGLKYELPPLPENKIDMIEGEFQEIKERLLKTDLPVLDALRKIASGVGPVVVREICHRAFANAQVTSGIMQQNQMQALEKAFISVREDYMAGGKPSLVRQKDGMPIEFSFTRLTQYEPECSIEEYENFSLMLEGYYAQKDRTERLRQKSKNLRKNAHNLFERAQRKQAARLTELAQSEQSDHLRIKGELLTANLHSFAKGETKIKLLNWYTNKEEEIKLNIRLTPSENAQKYFKEYKKKQTAAKMLEKLLSSGKKEIDYLETVLYEIDEAAGEAAIGEIRAELKAQGYLKYYKQKDKKQKPADFLRYISSEDFLILVGRNNAQNEKLTLKKARGKDLWFHTKNAPGSHVVVMSEGEDVPLQTREEAAMLAVVHSSQKNGSLVAVDYTMVKNIRKTSDLPMGMVLYEHYETGYVTPAADVIARLEEKRREVFEKK